MKLDTAFSLYHIPVLTGLIMSVSSQDSDINSFQLEFLSEL